MDEYNPPFMYKDGETGEAKGLYPELIRHLFEKLEIPVEVKAVPWRRALYFGESAQTGIGGIYRTTAREQIYDYSDPLFYERIHLFTLKENRDNPSSIGELEGKTIGVIQGWSYGDPFDSARSVGIFKVVEHRSDERNFKLLETGNIDYILAIKEAGMMVMQKEGLEDIIRIIPRPIIENPTHLVFNKRNNQTPLLERLNALIRNMENSGTYGKLIERILTEESDSR